MRRRWTSWSNFRAIGWSHGSVLAHALSSSWVQRLNRARKHSWPIGRWCSIFNMSKRIAIGTENKTIDWSELTILKQRDWTNWNESTRSAQRDLETPWEELIGGKTLRGGVWPREEILGGTPHGYTFLVETPSPGARRGLVQGTDD